MEVIIEFQLGLLVAHFRVARIHVDMLDICLSRGLQVTNSIRNFFFLT